MLCWVGTSKTNAVKNPTFLTVMTSAEEILLPTGDDLTVSPREPSDWIWTFDLDMVTPYGSRPDGSRSQVDINRSGDLIKSTSSQEGTTSASVQMSPSADRYPHSQSPRAVAARALAAATAAATSVARPGRRTGRASTEARWRLWSPETGLRSAIANREARGRGARTGCGEREGGESGESGENFGGVLETPGGRQRVH